MGVFLSIILIPNFFGLSKSIEEIDHPLLGNSLKILADTGNEHEFKEIVDKNSQEFIDYLHKIGLSLEHTSKTSNYRHSSTTIHTLRTQCFKVQFNDNFVRITPLK